MPTTIPEALACGLPVVATAVGGIPEEIEDGQTGFLTPPGDAAAFAHALQRMFADRALRHTMGERAVRVAREQFDRELMADRYLAWYQEILQARA